ncbi:MAG: DUF4317 domain-containing protein [Eubacterium sp.]|nr:DUF4317 domain-containing protein [Eubacterium sp.]MDY3773818.1 DUF4317 domain-containing protein [Eubacterium sp.]
MNKTEITEIKKIFKKDDNGITRICGCYVDAEKNKRMELKEAFYSLPEEEMFKYVDIFRKTLSGTLGKNLMNMEFPMEEETKEDGKQKFMMKLVDSGLQDDALLDEFYDMVIQTYEYTGNYFIILIHTAYDIPSITADGIENEDASDYVYNFILCSICPVKLSKAGLCYNPENNSIEDCDRDWIVQVPANGFLFPAFNERNTDIHSLLYFAKNADEIDIDFSYNLLGCTFPIPAKEQKETFHALVEESLGNTCDYETVKTLHENLNEMIEENKENPEPLELDKEDVKKILSSCGVSEEKIDVFEEKFTENVGEDQKLVADNIANLRKFEVKTPNVTIQVNPDRTDLVNTQIIDGVPCIVIECSDEVEVNGIRVANPM